MATGLLLLRANDWVKPVREAATETLLALAREAPAEFWLPYLGTMARLARTTVIEMPKAEPHQHNGAQILRWYDGDPDPLRLLERALAGTGAEVERFAPDVTYRPLFEIRTAAAASTPEFILSAMVGQE